MIVNKLKDYLGGKKVVACGFGTGLAWGALYFEPSSDVFIVDLIHYNV